MKASKILGFLSLLLTPLSLAAAIVLGWQWGENRLGFSLGGAVMGALVWVGLGNVLYFPSRWLGQMYEEFETSPEGTTWLGRAFAGWWLGSHILATTVICWIVANVIHGTYRDITMRPMAILLAVPLGILAVSYIADFVGRLTNLNRHKIDQKKWLKWAAGRNEENDSNLGEHKMPDEGQLDQLSQPWNIPKAKGGRPSPEERFRLLNDRDHPASHVPRSWRR